MNTIKPQIKFSKLFQSLNNNQSENGLENPFILIEKYLNREQLDLDLNNFEQMLLFQKELELNFSDSYSCFLLEFNLLTENKAEYLNLIVDFLCTQINSLKSISNSKLHYPLIVSSSNEVLMKICVSTFHLYLNSKNRKRLSKWYTLKEPITSFVFKIPREDKWFEQKFRHTLVVGYGKNFISPETSFSTIKALFEGKYLENKIDWIDNKSSLCYFIKTLVASNLILNPKNKHWEITAEFFLLKGEVIKQSELVNQKVTTDIRKKQNINRFFNDLEHYS